MCSAAAQLYLQQQQQQERMCQSNFFATVCPTFCCYYFASESDFGHFSFLIREFILFSPRVILVHRVA